MHVQICTDIIEVSSRDSNFLGFDMLDKPFFIKLPVIRAAVFKQEKFAFTEVKLFR